MGYIYDAMHRASCDGDSPLHCRKKRRPPAAPAPAPPAPDTAPGAPAPGAPGAPAPGAESPAPPDHQSQDIQGQSADVVHTIGPIDHVASPTPPSINTSQPPPAPLAFDPQANVPDPATCGVDAWRTTDIDVSNMDDRLVALIKPSSLMSEEYRSIRTSMLARWEHKRHLVHTITSATPQEGKTITSLNLGLSFAELRNRKTIVIECDLRLPQFSKLLALSDCPGMISVLEDRAKLKDVILNVGQTNLHMIVAGGRANDHAVQLLHSARLVSLLQQLRQKYDHVIIDTPPVIELADAGIIGAMSDDVQMIVRMGLTPKPLIDQAIRTLASYNAPVAGLIATDQIRHRGRYGYKYGYRYRYRYRYADKQAA